MKTLTLIRHAKSSWSEPGLDDFERPLNKRGKRDAPFMGKKLKKLIPLPDLFISSPAMRARATAEAIAHQIKLGEDRLVMDERLYHPSWHSFVEVIEAVDEELQSIFLCSHNPGATDFVNRVCGAGIDNVPTCGIVSMELDIEYWGRIDADCGKMIFFEYPKKHA